jgi:N-acetylglucosamine-6-phosphate deacetylase
MLYLLYDHLYTPEPVTTPGALLIDDGRILASGTQVPEPADATVIDARGKHVIPGLIDLQVNGAFGHDFTADPTTMWDVASRIPRFGITTLLPTIITSPPAMVACARQVMLEGPPAGYRGAAAPGLHIEGPFLSEARRGAHNTAYFRHPTRDAVAGWTPEGGVRLVTLAPELPGALDVIGWLAVQGTLVSAGHTNATFDEALRAFDAGIRYGTHLFNAMSPVHHREPGMAGALLSDPRLTVGLIPDGIHVHPAVIRLIWQAKGPDRLTLVSDAMGALGVEPGRYVIGDFEVIVDETSARLADGTLAGSILAQNAALRNLVAFTGCTLADALPTMTTTPARLLGLAGKGAIRPGWDADIAVIDDDFEVLLTIAGGEVVWQREEAAA